MDGAARSQLAIQSFGDTVTEDFFYDGSLPSKGCGWTNISSVAARKLEMLNAAAQLTDLWVPPSNKLEKLQGDLDGYHSIRINQQWRIIFRWTDQGPEDVEIIDYH